MVLMPLVCTRMQKNTETLSSKLNQSRYVVSLAESRLQRSFGLAVEARVVPVVAVFTRTASLTNCAFRDQIADIVQRSLECPQQNAAECFDREFVQLGLLYVGEIVEPTTGEPQQTMCNHFRVDKPHHLGASNVLHE